MTTAIIQARMSSTRLPGKVLMPLAGKPMLAHQLERLARARHVEHIVVATSTGADDDDIVRLCEGCGVTCTRGDLDDVLDRYYQAARECSTDPVIRLTADCPLIDPDVVDRLVVFFQAGGYDYASNIVQRTWPRGLDTEIFTFSALERAWRDAISQPEREHVTLHFYATHPERFSLGSLTGDTDHSHLRWTVDEPADLEMVRRIYDALYPARPDFTTADVLEFLEGHPDVVAINSDVKQKPLAV